jgi:lysozyme family protein
MESSWPQASQFIIFIEGGLVDDPNDPGGLTKFGISQRSYPSLDIASLTVDRALDIYHKDYWLANGCSTLPYPLDILVFDASVNCDGVEAIKFLQRTAGITDDGVFGPQTKQAAVNVARRPHFAAVSYLSYREKFYADLETTRPTNAKVERGWMFRCLRLLRFILTGELE